ncbi:MAG: LysM peptidoglycan-binding domain-containing protein [Sphingobacteriales bacterium]|nr:MAG: LysM peptidoglycan-binding domain-containing protein [Sphingobacteriales bacterium]
MQLKSIFIILLIIIRVAGAAQSRDELIQQYITSYKNLAIEEMKRTGVPAAIKLAQGIHETEAGNSVLVKKSNNHFGIKCKTGWDGPKVYHDDDERGECFRSYTAAEASYRDHSNFLKNSQRYAFLFALDPTDYKGWAYGLKKAGYATNIKYSQILIKLIEEYHLDTYSLIALGKIPDIEADLLVKLAPETKPEIAIAEVAIDYPSGRFTINKTSVVYAAAGNSWLQLAQQYEVPLARLLDFNDVYSDGVLVKGQLVFLQRKRKTGDKEFHTVMPGETVYSIAQLEGIRIDALREYNKLAASDEPAVGEKLYLQDAAPQAPVLAVNTKVINSPAAHTLVKETIKHIVKPKETLYSISKKYAVPVTAIVEWNKLQGYELKMGQELLILKNQETAL